MNTVHKKELMLFVDKDSPYTDENNCAQCRWKSTEMCPLSPEYVGRQLIDPYKYYKETKICHRFVMTAEEEQRRWNKTMDKLQENLKIDED